mgnify:CR=1 FL=1
MAIVAGVAVAVAGWLVNEYFSRRAARRNIRIEYLLSAFRRLEYASNRTMTPAHQAAVEEAVSDVQLLGSPEQVRMAIQFARQMAEEQSADTEPLLLDLRATLRMELQLEEVPRERVWLRLDPARGADGPSVGVGALARWEQQTREVEASIRASVPQLRPFASGDWHRVGQEGLSSFAIEMLEESERSSPIGAITACERVVADQVRSMLERADVDAADIRGLADLAEVAHQHGLIAEATSNGLRGLETMHSMALLDEGGRRVTERELRQYIGLADGLLLALQLPYQPGGDR